MNLLQTAGINFRKNVLLFESDGKVAGRVYALFCDSRKIAHPCKRHINQTIQNSYIRSPRSVTLKPTV